MLQQTKAASVENFFPRFLKAFPTIEALAAASEQEVLAQWQGLGYYRRAKHLALAAKQGPLPSTSAELQKRPGIGRYTANAVASIAFKERTACVDVNVIRVLCRLSAKNSMSISECENESLRLMRSSNPGEWNQALMELGATVCLPAAPLCSRCPISSCCKGSKSPHLFPAPKQKPATIELKHFCLCTHSRNNVALCQIPTGNWWEGMWEFPRIKSSTGRKPIASFNYSVTNHRIKLEAFAERCEKPNSTRGLRWVAASELERLPMPSPQRKVAKSLMEHLCLS